MTNMRKFLRLLYYYGKAALLDFSFSFWTVLFPILLGTMMFFGFGNLNNRMAFKPIPVAVSQGGVAYTIFNAIEVLDVKAVNSDEIGHQMVEDKEVEGYVDAQLNVHVSKTSGLNPTIIRNIATQVKQSLALGADARNLDFSQSYLDPVNQDTNYLVVLFYAVLASTCFYAMFTSVHMCTLTQANLSTIGARFATTPVPKGQLVAVSLIISCTLNIVSNFLFVMYTHYVLQVPILKEVGPTVSLVVIANICATVLGSALGYSNSWSLEGKIGIIQVVLHTLSAFAGMMGPFIRTFIDEYVPVINEWNPIAIVTNTLYRINDLGQSHMIWQGIGILTLYSVIGTGIAYLLVRREQYDSI